MQVRYEGQLLEPIGFRQRNFQLSPLDQYTLSQNTFNQSVELIAAASNANLLAIYLDVVKQIAIVDTKSKIQRDRFLLKACDKKYSRQSFCVKALHFSPDAQRIAVAQSDCIIYIYKLPINSWLSNNQTFTQQPNATSDTDPINQATIVKPTITGKFVCSCPITCLLWDEPGILFGTQDGKIKLITFPPQSTTRQQANDNQQSGQKGAPNASQQASQQPKVSSLFASPRGVMPLCLTHRNRLVLIGFIDGTVVVLALQTSEPNNQANQDILKTGEPDPVESSRRQSIQVSVSQASIEHPCPVQKITVLNDNQNGGFYFACSGTDGRIGLYEAQLARSSSSNSPKNFNKQLRVNLSQLVDLSDDEVNGLEYSPTNEIIAVATNRRLAFLRHDSDSVQGSYAWRLESAFIELDSPDNPSQVGYRNQLSGIKWSRDGSQLFVGTVTGSLELFSCNWFKESVGEKLDICHIAKNRVRISDRSRNLLATYKLDQDIKRVNVIDAGRSVIIWSSSSNLLLAKLGAGSQGLQSEIKLSSSNILQASRAPHLKFHFDFSNLVLIYNELNHEVLIVQLGSDSILYSVKFPPSSVGHFSRCTISLRQFPFNNNPTSEQYAPKSRDSLTFGSTTKGNQLVGDFSLQNIAQRQRVAYISPIDRHKLILIELNDFPNESRNQSSSKSPERILEHHADIEYIEFSLSSDNLLIVDAEKSLHLLKTNDIASGKTIRLIDAGACKFASWLPQSEILIAQYNHMIFICYQVDKLHQDTLINLINKSSSKPGKPSVSTSPKCTIEHLDSRSFNPLGKAPLIDLCRAGNQFSLTHPIIVKLQQDFGVRLSNGKTISVDPIRVKFFTQLINGSLKMAQHALEASEQQQQQSMVIIKSNEPLWIKLLWMAVDLNEPDVVVTAMQRLNYKPSWIEFFVGNKGEGEGEGDESSHELQIKLALFRGDWNKFEQLAEPEDIQATYRRMNKWHLLMDYLARSQKFRQRDLAERDYRDWLVSRGRHLEAAKMIARNGADIEGALELLVSAGRHLEAAQLLLSEQRQQQDQSNAGVNLSYSPIDLDKVGPLIGQILAELLRLEKFNLAARINHFITANYQDAMDLYVRAYNFEPAIEIALKLSIEPQKIVELRESYAQQLITGFKSHLLSHKTATKAIDQLLLANKTLKALETAIELDQLEKAKDILIDACKNDENLPEKSDKLSEGDIEALKGLSLKLSDSLEKRGQLDEAVECLSVAGHQEMICDFWLAHGRYKQAFEAAVEHNHAGSREQALLQFEQLADSIVDELLSAQNSKMSKSDNDFRPLTDANYHKAEQIYLEVLQRPQLAIKMNRKLSQFDRLLELVSEHEPDQLESELLLIAREFEAAGKLDVAERYLLRVSQSEWTNVVRMYRLASNWEEAFRVAQEHCSSPRDPLLVQLAFWWSRSLNDLDKAREILAKLNLTRPVIEFCCENRNFQFGLELCNNILAASDKTDTGDILKLKSTIVRAQALQLEQQNKFAEAEQTLINAGHLRDAIKMYMENERYSDAIRLIEEQINSPATTGKFNDTDLGKLLNETLVECARSLLSDVTLDSTPSQDDNFSKANSLSKSKRLSPSDLSKLVQAREFYLRAQKPELAVAMYQERGMWQEAIQLAQRYAPSLLEQVESALDLVVNQDLREVVGESKGTQNGDDRLGSFGNTTDAGTEEKPTQLDQPSADESGHLTRQINELMITLNDQMQRDPTGASMTLLVFIQSILPVDRLNKRDISVCDQLSSLERVLNSSIVNTLFGSISNDQESSQANLLESFQKLIMRMLASCKWGLPVSSDLDQDHHNSWPKLLNILQFVRKRLMLRPSSPLASLLDDSIEMTRQLQKHCDSLSQMAKLCNMASSSSSMSSTKAISSGRRTPGAMRKSTQRNNVNNQKDSNCLNLTPSSAPNLLAKYPNLVEILESIAEQTLVILKLISNFLAKRKEQYEEHQMLLKYPIYICGLWLLANGRPVGTRKLWTRLIELIENSKKRQKVGQEGALFAVQLEDYRIQEVRAWLLESLLNIDSSPTDKNDANLDLDFLAI